MIKFKCFLIITIFMCGCGVNNAVEVQNENNPLKVNEMKSLYKMEQFNHLILKYEKNKGNDSLAVESLYAKSLIKTGRYTDFKTHMAQWLTRNPSVEGRAVFNQFIKEFESL